MDCVMFLLHSQKRRVVHASTMSTECSIVVHLRLVQYLEQDQV